MAIDGYTARKSIVQGGSLDLHVSNTRAAADATVRIRVERVGAEGQPLFEATFTAGPEPTPPRAYEEGCGWPRAYTLAIPDAWQSGLYQITIANADGDHERMWFVVRPRVPGVGSGILVGIPFATTQAYNDWGGNSLYPSAAPGRARRVSFERPGGTHQRDAEPFVRWLAKEGIAADFCTSMDLHEDADQLRHHRLFVSAGHDEYWSKEMRDRVEAFVRSGGNAAFFSANTCYWQIRFEDGGRTMVCYRDALEDPLAGVDDARVTVHWRDAPVSRSENYLTGVSYWEGAGYWIDEEGWRESEYRVSFPEHWVFDGTGLALGAAFGKGAVGYETDAAEIVYDCGIPRATGRYGTRPSFVVLAVADLRHWRANGQGGLATMGVYRAGGTVFTAASADWASALGASPEVTRITRNVLARLSTAHPERGWERVGSAVGIVAMAAAVGRLFAVTRDGVLSWREPVEQNLSWKPVGVARSVVALASPIEASEGHALGLYIATREGRLYWREPVVDEVLWQPVGAAPDLMAMAAVGSTLFGVTQGGALLALSLAGAGGEWQPIGRAAGVVALTGLNGKLYAVTADGELRWRRPVLVEAEWIPLGGAPGITSLVGIYGKLFGATYDGALLQRDAF